MGCSSSTTQLSFFRAGPKQPNLPTNPSLRTPHSAFRTPRGHWGEGVTTDEMADYTWLRPEIEAEIKFTEWTAGGLLRHAEFVTLREM